MARGIHSKGVADEFLAHPRRMGHADQIAERIVQLGGEPTWPDGLRAEATPNTSPQDPRRHDQGRPRC
jgi:bacterioferritin